MRRASASLDRRWKALRVWRDFPDPNQRAVCSARYVAPRARVWLRHIHLTAANQVGELKRGGQPLTRRDTDSNGVRKTGITIEVVRRKRSFYKIQIVLLQLPQGAESLFPIGPRISN